jgi:hypothetical protein
METTATTATPATTATTATMETLFMAPRRPPYPRPPDDHAPITAPEVTLRQRLTNVVGTLKGPLWMPLINKGFNKAWIRIIGDELGPQDQIVYDVEFYPKGRPLGEVCLARLTNEDEANNLCTRLNLKDPTLRELAWLYIQDRDRVTHDDVDYYQMEGRFHVTKKLVGQK